MQVEADAERPATDRLPDRPEQVQLRGRPIPGDERPVKREVHGVETAVPQIPDQFVMKATAHIQLQDGAPALEATQRALPILQELAAADPKNAEAQHDLAFAYGEQGFALSLIERHDEAEKAFLEAIAIRKKLIAADPLNREEQRDLKRIESALAEARLRR